MEDISIRAIVIGVSLFVTMITLTAIISFYNVSVLTAQGLHKRANIAEEYDYIMKSDVVTDDITGIELRNLINKYAKNDKVNIDLTMSESKRYNNINNTWINKIENISEAKLNMINSSDKYSVSKTTSSGTTRLTVLKVS